MVDRSASVSYTHLASASANSGRSVESFGHNAWSAKEFAEAEAGVQKEIDRLMGIQGKRSVDSIHKELGLSLIHIFVSSPSGSRKSGC